jgi:transposase
MKDVRGVRSFVGCDAHGKHCSFKAYSAEGVVLRECNVPTEANALMKAVRGLPRPVWVMVESSCMAEFVKRSLSATVERVIACETRENRWISQSDDASDPADADRLARLLRMGEFKEVFMPSERDGLSRQVLSHYQKASGDVVRIKNRLKAEYRRDGVPTEGSALYEKEHRAAWLAKSSSGVRRFLLEQLYLKLDIAEEVLDRLGDRLRALLKNNRGYRLLQTLPGIGPSWAAVFVAVIVDPFRFPDKRKLWKYAGLGGKRPWSGDETKARTKGSKNGNRLLKYAALSAAHAAVRSDNGFARHYHEMLAKGIKPDMALRTTARKILATAWAMWKNGTEYRDAA